MECQVEHGRAVLMLRLRAGVKRFGNLGLDCEKPEVNGSCSPQVVIKQMNCDQLTLVICCKQGSILPSYIRTIISYCKDPYQPTRIMECNKGFEHCSDALQLDHLAPACGCGLVHLAFVLSWLMDRIGSQKAPIE